MNKAAKILTFSNVTNYGALLQCYALQNELNRHYKSVQILNYNPEYFRKQENSINTYSMKSIIASLYSLPSFKKRKSNFKKFKNNYLNQTKEYKSNDKIENLEENDIYIGSDQVWNLDITNNDKTFFRNI